MASWRWMKGTRLPRAIPHLLLSEMQRWLSFRTTTSGAKTSFMSQHDVVHVLESAYEAAHGSSAAKKALGVLDMLTDCMYRSTEEPFPYILDVLVAPLLRLLQEDVSVCVDIAVSAVVFVKQWLVSKPDSFCKHFDALGPLLIALACSKQSVEKDTCGQDARAALARGILDVATMAPNADIRLLSVLDASLKDPTTCTPRTIVARWCAQVCEALDVTTLEVHVKDGMLSRLIQSCADVHGSNEEERAHAGELRRYAVRMYLVFLKMPVALRSEQEAGWNDEVRKTLARGLREDMVEKRLDRIGGGHAQQASLSAVSMLEHPGDDHSIASAPADMDTANDTRTSLTVARLRPSMHSGLDVRTKMTRGKKRLSNVPRVSVHGLDGDGAGLDDWGALSSMLSGDVTPQTTDADGKTITNHTEGMLNKSKSIEALGQLSKDGSAVAPPPLAATVGFRRKLNQGFGRFRQSILFVGGAKRPTSEDK